MEMQKGELYIIKLADFKERYKNPEKLGDDFSKFESCGKCRAFEYNGPSFCFIAPWKETMIVNSGDFLATNPSGDVAEVYRIKMGVFKKDYEVVDR